MSNCRCHGLTLVVVVVVCGDGRRRVHAPPFQPQDTLGPHRTAPYHTTPHTRMKRGHDHPTPHHTTPQQTKAGHQLPPFLTRRAGRPWGGRCRGSRNARGGARAAPPPPAASPAPPSRRPPGCIVHGLGVAGVGGMDGRVFGGGGCWLCVWMGGECMLFSASFAPPTWFWGLEEEEGGGGGWMEGVGCVCWFEVGSE
jgi:hypothetical protein